LKISEVAKLSALDRFLYWIRERHNVYLRRKVGQPKPWTDDEVLQSFFFTNPFRENDKVTVWFRENIREPLRDDPRVIFATIAFRWFNLPETAEVLMGGPGKAGGEDTCPGVKYGWLEAWDADGVLERLDRERKAKAKIFTGAYMINSPGGEPKLEAIVRRVTNVWEDRQSIIEFFQIYHAARHRDPRGPLRLEQAHDMFVRFDGLGGFMSYEVVCDLRYTKWLENAPDKMTWCNPGPGAIRGLYRLTDTPFKKGDNATSPPRPKDWQAQMVRLLETARKRLRMPLEMREIEHSLCEWDKYERARLGDGRMKRTYNGRG
jgi:hypothetical protein